MAETGLTEKTEILLRGLTRPKAIQSLLLKEQLLTRPQDLHLLRSITQLTSSQDVSRGMRNGYAVRVKLLSSG